MMLIKVQCVSSRSRKTNDANNDADEGADESTVCILNPDHLLFRS
jgi:hypothetical protein